MKLSDQVVKSLATIALCLAFPGRVFSQSDHAEYHGPPEPGLPYAERLFNAIHAAMKQWDSSVHHNGMSFFLATVPEGTEFYHGSPSPEPHKGLEWLAFEAEHALGFAHPSDFFPAPAPNDGFDDEKPSPHPPGRGQQPMIDTHEGGARKPLTPASEYGYLHTYVTNKELRLIYIDGMAAAKSGIGPMDAGNIVLLNNTFPPRRGFQEYEKAFAMCDIARDEWDGRIHGFLRMEAGFEIILCSFEDNLDFVRVTASKPHSQYNKLFDTQSNEAYLKALASRYSGIGKDKVRLDQEHFVTAYNYTKDLFPEGPIHPRLTNVSDDDITRMRRDLWCLARYGAVNPTAVDWQAISERIVLRYADVIESLAQGSPANPSFFQKIESMIQPFLSYDELDKSDSPTVEEVAERCAQQFIPRSAPKDSLAGTAVYGVSHKICYTFSSFFFHEKARNDVSTAHHKISSLKNDLAWPVWKKCRGCGVDEVCMIPMWPIGNKEDYEHPQCRNATYFSWWGDYWGPMRD